MRHNMSSEEALAAMLSIPAMLIGSALGGVAHAVAREGRGKGHRSGRKSGGGGVWVASTDIKWLANEGEVRIASLLVENNRAQDAVISATAQPWIDNSGNQVTGGGPIFTPTALTLKAGDSGVIKAEVNVTAPLLPGSAYYTEIVLGGCSRKPITVGLAVNPTCFDAFAPCDPCCGTKFHLVEFCRDCGCNPCTCKCECGETAKCSGCGSCSCSCECDPCSPWPGNWDPHHHWIDSCNCDVIMIPRVPPQASGGTGK